MTGDELSFKTYGSEQMGSIVFISKAASFPGGQTEYVTTVGYYYYNGLGKWLHFYSDTVFDQKYWATSGNSVNNNNNFIGTLNNFDFITKTNDTERMRITALGNIGIGTTNPDPSAILDLTSISQGIKIPVMNGIQRRAIQSPAKGLNVYDTDLNCNVVFNGSQWKSLCGVTYRIDEGSATIQPGASSIITKTLTLTTEQTVDIFAYFNPSCPTNLNNTFGTHSIVINNTSVGGGVQSYTAVNNGTSSQIPSYTVQQIASETLLPGVYTISYKILCNQLSPAATNTQQRRMIIQVR
jgi:hypothetical protein